MPAAAAVGGMYFATKAARTRGTKAVEWSPNSYPWREQVDTTSVPPGATREVYVGREKVTATNTVNYYPPTEVAVDKYFGSVAYEAEADATPGELTLLSGEKISPSDFGHSNTQPFFGSTVKQPKFSADATESRLDTTSGAGSQLVKKAERAPLFAPTAGNSHTHGAPSATDFAHSRQVPALRAANVLPFQQQRVAPGLDAGYGTEGAGGFNAGMAARQETMPRGVDDLRAANNPKLVPKSYTATPGGTGLNTQRGVIGEVHKNRPERSFPMGQERNLTTTGVGIGPTARSTEVQRPLRAEGTSRDNYGAGALVDGGQASTRGIAPPVHRSAPLLGGAAVLPAAAAQGQMGPVDPDSLVRAGYAAAPNARMVTGAQTDGLWGAASAAVSELFAPLLDTVKAPRRGDFIGVQRTGQAGGGAHQAPPPRRTPDVPKYKQQLESYPTGPAVSAHPQASVESSAISQTAVPTRRAEASRTDYTPGAGGTTGPMSYYGAYAGASGPAKETTLATRPNPGGTGTFTSGHGVTRAGQTLGPVPPAGPKLHTEAPSAATLGVSSTQRQMWPEVGPQRLDGGAGGLEVQARSNPFAQPGYATGAYAETV